MTATAGLDLLAFARRHVGTWQPRLDLADWRIDVEVGAVANDRLCEVLADASHQEATITWPADFEQRARAYYQLADDDVGLTRLAELSVVHELLHVAEEPSHDRFARALADRLGPLATGDALWRTWLDYREDWVTRLSVVLLRAGDGDWTEPRDGTDRPIQPERESEETHA